MLRCLISSSRDLNPISTNYVAINHETKSKKNIAFICHEALHTKTINLYASIKNTWKFKRVWDINKPLLNISYMTETWQYTMRCKTQYEGFGSSLKLILY